MEIKKQPHSEESEIVVIASVLLGGAYVYDKVTTIVNSGDFFITVHQGYFELFGRMVSEGEDIDDITVLERMRNDGIEDDLGGIAKIYALQSRIDTPLRAGSAANTVAEKSRLRKIIRASRGAIEASEALLGTSEEISATLEDDIQKISDTSTKGSTLISSSVDELLVDFESMLDGTYETTAMPIGIDRIDSVLDSGGVGNGEVMVITAPTSCGKTQLALCAAIRKSITNGDAGLYVSFEMPAKQLVKRMAQTISGVNLKRIKDRVITREEKSRVWDAAERIRRSSLYIENGAKNIAELRAKARTHMRKHGITYIVIDYLQLVPWNPRLDKKDGIADVSHQIKLMAMELDIPVILLCQVNREGAKRESGLTLYDLKDSGDIENDADIVFLMWPNGKDVDEARRLDASGKPYVELCYNIAKQREGERDVKGKLKFISHFGRFQ
jgi:replicative DNA helicase